MIKLEREKLLKTAGMAGMIITVAFWGGLAYMMAYEKWTFFGDLWGDFLVMALIFTVFVLEYGLYRLATKHDMHRLHMPIVVLAAACMLMFPRYLKVINGPDLRWDQLRGAITQPRERPTTFPY
jgi:hypothetical protein